MKRKYGIILIASTLLILAGAAIYGIARYQQTYDALTYPIPFVPISTTSDHQPAALEKAAAKTSHLEIAMIYKHGCKNCEAVEKTAVHAIRSGRDSNKNLTYIMAEGHHPDVVRYGHENGVTHTPTVLVKYRGITLYRYTGINKQHLARVLSGKNPNTGRPFVREVPILTTVQNDLNGSVTQLPAGTVPGF